MGERARRRGAAGHSQTAARRVALRAVRHRWRSPGEGRLAGFDGPPGEGGKLLCEQEFPVDLPPGDATHDIDVPKNAKKDGKDI